MLLGRCQSSKTTPTDRAYTDQTLETFGHLYLSQLLYLFHYHFLNFHFRIVLKSDQLPLNIPLATKIWMITVFFYCMKVNDSLSILIWFWNIKYYIITHTNNMKFKYRYQQRSFIGTQSGFFIYISSITAFALQWKCWVVATETIWPANSKTFAI